MRRSGRPLIQWLFRRICAIWSLHAQKRGFLSLGRPPCLHCSAVTLASGCGKIEGSGLHSAYSAACGEWSSQRSLDSFKSLDRRNCSISSGGKSRGTGKVVFAFQLWGFRFSGLSCRDDYEGLCSKCLLGLHLAGHGGGHPRLIYKFETTYGWTQLASFDPTSRLLRKRRGLCGASCHRLSNSSPVLEWKII